MLYYIISVSCCLFSITKTSLRTSIYIIFYSHTRSPSRYYIYIYIADGLGYHDDGDYDILGMAAKDDDERHNVPPPTSPRAPVEGMH